MLALLWRAGTRAGEAGASSAWVWQQQREGDGCGWWTQTAGRSPWRRDILGRVTWVLGPASLRGQAGVLRGSVCRETLRGVCRTEPPVLERTQEDRFCFSLCSLISMHLCSFWKEKRALGMDGGQPRPPPCPVLWPAGSPTRDIAVPGACLQIRGPVSAAVGVKGGQPGDRADCALVYRGARRPFPRPRSEGQR